MTLRESSTVLGTITLPDITLGRAPVPGVPSVYAHRADEDGDRLMISFSTHALSFVLSGRKRLFSGKRYVEVEEGGAVLFAAGHCLSTDTRLGPEPYRSLLFFFDDVFLERVLAKQGAQRPAPRSEEQFHTLHPSRQLAALRDETARTLATFPAMSPARIALRLEEALLVLLETEGSDAFTVLRRPNGDDPVARVQRTVEGQWQRGLSTEEMAFLCHMSASSFKRHFRTAYGVTPGRWLVERRLGYAAHLLRVERKRPAEVFEAAGFASASSFTQSFKARFGTTPSAYREGNEP
ncbi:helix-turn-helix domain-containing protein [Parvularcula dongshanensis]|uniref:AraC-like DNA-binding protein n=1 Tax=Parvularcula dongshanensis TaxID=1173995 RepID=A0A840I5J7_9PROT|nr:AraC family transcriptional regulator [Parvularcula dongshanensis]MBB4659595.1 AraC-like DNA-binding protein [Parvularcula dongshanensis]